MVCVNITRGSILLRLKFLKLFGNGNFSSKNDFGRVLIISIILSLLLLLLLLLLLNSIV